MVARNPSLSRSSTRPKVTGAEPVRRALSGLSPPASRALPAVASLAAQGQTLEHWSLCQPSGPDGEGQARGQAPNARGEPL
jgi:hypothetical protein